MDSLTEDELLFLYASLLKLQEVGQDSSNHLALQLGSSVAKGILVQKFLGIGKKGIVKNRLISTIQKLGMRGLGGVIPAASLAGDIVGMVSEARKQWKDMEDVVDIFTKAKLDELLVSVEDLEKILTDAGWKRTRFCVEVMEARNAAWRHLTGKQAATKVADVGSAAREKTAAVMAWFKGKDAPESNTPAPLPAESLRKSILLGWIRELEIPSTASDRNDLQRKLPQQRSKL